MIQYKDLELFAENTRIQMLKALGEPGFGYLGGAMSAVDVLDILHGGVMNADPKNPQWEDRDHFVTSKGHTDPTLYAVLALKSYFPVERLLTINTNGIKLPSHPDRNSTTGVDMSADSLGQGMFTAIGIAYGSKMLGKDSYTHLLLGDGESQEGQVWERALYAPQHRLSHLTAFLDYNRQQLDDYTKDICDLGDMCQKFQDFGWYALEVDGHDVDAIYGAITLVKHQQEKPTMIVLQTQKGKGCFFAEGTKYNHHTRFSKEQCGEVIARLEKEGYRNVVQDL